MQNLDAKSVAGSQLLNVIIKAAGVHVTTAHLEDSFRINSRSNTVSILTDNLEGARKYAEIKDFTLHGKKVEVYGHGTTPGRFRRIVVPRLLDPSEDVNEAEILEHLIRCNPHTAIIDAKRCGRSPSILITLGTQKSPGCIKFLCGLFPFHDYLETKQACTSCWELGHKAEACPTPNTGRCPNCGEIHSHPARVEAVRTEYDCTPRCLICNEQHYTGSRVCKQKYKAIHEPKTPLKKPTAKEEDFVALTPRADKTTTDQTKNYSQALRNETSMAAPPTPQVEQESMQVEERTTRKRGQRTEFECIDASAVTNSEGPKARRVESSPASDALLESLAKAVHDMQESTTKSITAFGSTLTAFDERLHKIEYIGLLQQSVKNQMNPKPATQNGK
ncbi:uncharacterized protein LOC115323253 [Ixodes scapularis]|uniref:uncharacterized protein LOC115323253 n=1 Tax=Ixodes scapularis TaxID=6945 RepID=UPI001A9D4E64|nr:uncharacterized protein LOC115323253 [Ixodes scapularis]